MSDGIIAISRMQDEVKDAENEEEAGTSTSSKRKKSKLLSDFVLTDFGTAEEETASEL